ncbi:histidine kinase [Fluviicola sp.]|uniref:histidine kinase n=1 Tax=Fluviicola sp. TaxID=1917219 RepID=UPI003D2B79D9
MIKYLLIQILLSFSFIGFSQGFLSKTYNQNNGLPSYEIYRCIEDKQGLMWFATLNGVAKFDGKKFKVFNTEDGLPTNDIWHINVDSKNRIWLEGYLSGIYYIENDRVKKIKSSETVCKDFTMLYKGEKGKILSFMSADGKFKVTYDGQKLVKLKQDKNDLFSILDIKTTRNLDEIILQNLKAFNQILKKEIGGLQFNNQNVFFINPTSDFVIIKNGKSKVYRGFDSTKRVRWIESKLDSYLKHNKSIKWIYIDSKQNLWVINRSGSVTIIPRFKHVLNVQQYNFPNSDLVAKFFTFDDQSIFVANRNSTLIKYSKSDYSSSNFFVPGIKNIQSIKSIGSYIYVLKLDSILVFDENNRNWTLANTRKGLQNHLNSFYSFSWFDSLTFISGFETYKLIHPKKIIKADSINNQVRVRNSLILGSKVFLFSNDIGLVINGKSKRIINKRKIGPISTVVQFEDKILFGTSGNGMRLMDQKLTILDSSLMGLSINSIFVDKCDIFVATNKGVYTTQIRNNTFSKMQKIYIGGFHTNKELLYVWCDQKKVFLCGVRDFFVLDKRLALSAKPRKIDLFFTNIECNEKKVINKHSFNSEENNFEFSFCGLLYESFGNVQYKYKLVGHDYKFHYTTDGKIRYDGLNAGKYTLIVYAQDGVSMNNTNFIKYSFQIRAKFTDGIVFKILVFLLFSSIIALISYWIIKKRSFRMQLESKNSILRLQALRSQMNPHLVFNALNSMQSAMILKGEKEANRFVTNFSSFIRKTLDNSRYEKIRLADEIEYLISYIELEKQRLNGLLNYKVEYNDHIKRLFIPTMLIQPLVENAILHGLVPLKSERTLLVRFSENNDSVIILIEDNGIGIEASYMIKKKRIISLGVQQY